MSEFQLNAQDKEQLEVTVDKAFEIIDSDEPLILAQTGTHLERADKVSRAVLVIEDQTKQDKKRIHVRDCLSRDGYWVVICA